MNSAINNIVINRYPGVKPFSTSENFMFFGRETDIEALNSLIFVNQTIVLYGKSGYGKSSLINAGIIPRLQKNQEWEYFSMRFNNFSEKETETNLSPFQTARQRLSDNLVVEKDNLLDSLIPNEGSFWYWIKQNQLHKSKGKFIIFFDQFEELFTYPKEQIKEFSEQLSQLLYTTLPVNFKRKLADLESNTDLISDEKHDFLYEKPDIKVIFSIRSDRLSLLNLLKDKHPSILQNSYELDALNIEDAKSAITEPAKLPIEFGFVTSDFSFTTEAITKIIDSIANPQDGKIEAATLQIVCRFVEDTIVKEKMFNEITASELGDITDIFQQYYQGVLEKLTTIEKGQAQKLIEDELIEGNRRNPLSENYIKSKFGISEKLLFTLEQSSLLKKERDARGTILYEVSHDSLIGAINKIAENRRKEDDEKKQIELQLQIENEKKRSNELVLLNEKANKRLKQVRVALLIAIIAISATVLLAFYSYNSKVEAQESARKAEEQEKIANQNSRLAEEEKNKAEKALRDLKKAGDMEKFNSLINNANGLINDATTACQFYKMADSILIKYPEDSTKRKELTIKLRKTCGQ